MMMLDKMALQKTLTILTDYRKEMIISGRIIPNPETETFLGEILNDMHDDKMTVIQVAQKYQKLLLFEEKHDLIFEICKELEQSW